jgi:hypothetical protein
MRGAREDGKTQRVFLQDVLKRLYVLGEGSRAGRVATWAMTCKIGYSITLNGHDQCQLSLCHALRLDST